MHKTKEKSGGTVTVAGYRKSESFPFSKKILNMKGANIIYICTCCMWLIDQPEQRRVVAVCALINPERAEVLKYSVLRVNNSLFNTTCLKFIHSVSLVVYHFHNKNKFPNPFYMIFFPDFFFYENSLQLSRQWTKSNPFHLWQVKNTSQRGCSRTIAVPMFCSKLKYGALLCRTLARPGSSPKCLILTRRALEGKKAAVNSCFPISSGSKNWRLVEKLAPSKVSN